MAESANGLDTRRFIEAVLWIAATDSTWPDLPASYGNFHGVYQRFARWTKLDAWDVACMRLHGDPRLLALQRLVRQERDIQQRRDTKAAQAAREGADTSMESTARLQALEARVDKMEALLRALLDESSNDGHKPR